MAREKKYGRLIVLGLAVFLVLMLIDFYAHVHRTNEFNALERKVGMGEHGDCTVELYPRGGAADSWDKRNVEVGGEVVTFTGTTYDCAVKNFGDSKISGWTLRIGINRDCYINNSWCGTTEIHQTDPKTGAESSQRLDLRDYDERDLRLRHFLVDQDLYIPLSKGDYIIYHPSAVSGEFPVNAFNGSPGKIVSGFIFYHKKGSEPDFSCEMTYTLERPLLHGTRPKVLLACFVLWVLLAVVRLTFTLTSSNLRRESASVIRAISNIYSNLYKINLDKDTFQEIRAEETVGRFFAGFTGARQAFRSLPDALFRHGNIKEVREFYDVDSWRERLAEADSCSADFKAAAPDGTARWTRTNLIVCRRNAKRRPVEVICALQDVDEEVSERERHKLMMERFAADLSTEVAEQTLHIQEMQRKIVSSLADMIGTRDGNTGGHVKRTSDVVEILVNEIIRRNRTAEYRTKFSRITKRLGEDIIRAAPMHDLGKIFIDTRILCKPSKLNDDEYKTMKTHAEHSGEIVNLILRDVEEKPFVNLAYNIARYHHERWDGLGYPEGAAGGKIGEGIPMEARIMAVADVYDALVSKRCYKEPMGFDTAFRIMLEGMGKQFDPDMKDIFISCRAELENYYTNAR